MDYFIHIADPGFPEPPWPGERRLGPFSLEAAVEQAVSDAAQGISLAVGIYSEEESTKRASTTARSVGRAEVRRSQIKAKSDVLAKKMYDDRIAQVYSDVEAMKASLPPGMGLEEALELLKVNRDVIEHELNPLEDEAT